MLMAVKIDEVTPVETLDEDKMDQYNKEKMAIAYFSTTHAGNPVVLSPSEMTGYEGYYDKDYEPELYEHQKPKTAQRPHTGISHKSHTLPTVTN
jgi:hypothetical protein